MNSPKIFIKKKISTQFNNPILRNKLSINVKDVDLSVRAVNALLNQNINTIKDLIEQTESELKRFPNMGQRSINEIKETLDQHSLYLGMEIQNLDDETNTDTINSVEVKEEDKLIEASENQTLEIIKEFDETTLSVRSKNVLKNLNCNYIGDIIFLSRETLINNDNLGIKSLNEIETFINNLDLNFGDIIEPWNKDVIKTLRDDLIGKISDDDRQELINKNKYLEIELKKILEECIETPKKDLSIKGRIIDILINRFGLDGTPAKTLETIGQKYNVTRERIRQNQENGLRKLQKLKPFTPILDKIFEELSQLLPITEIEFNRVLKEKKLTLVEWDFKGLQDFYENIGVKTDFCISKINNVKIISKDSVEKVFKSVMVNINKKISTTGLCSLSDCLNFKEVFLNNLKKETIKKFLQTKSMFTWLDDDEEWFTFYASRNRLSNLITKAATGSSTVETDMLFNKIKNFHRLDNVKYSKDVFISYCKKSFDCIIDDTEILFNSPQSKLSNYDGYQGNIIAPNEQKIIDIFNKFGPILSIEDLQEFSENSGVKRDSLNMMLQFSPLFHRIDIGFYKLAKKLKEKKVEKIVSIINLESLNFNKDECPVVKGKKTYIEVNQNGHLLKSLPYERPLRLLPDGSYGIVYKRKVYPIINSIRENNDKREEVDID